MNADTKDFTAILKDRGKIGDRDLARARALADETGEPLHLILSRLGMVAEEIVTYAVAKSLGLPTLGDADYPKFAILDGAMSADFIQTCQVLPIAEDGAGVTIAMSNPFDEETIRAIELKLGKNISPCVAQPFQLDRHIRRLYGASSTAAASAPNLSVVSATDVERLREMASDAPVVRMVNGLIEQAVADGASDIHIQPNETQLMVRQRIDGLLRNLDAPATSTEAIVSRIKIMANLDIVERRRPQDGRCRVNVQGRSIDIRVSCVPTIHGESVVLRILDKASAPLKLEKLGLGEQVRKGVERIIASGNGVLFATGPTGSGKTTTLYAALQILNQHDTMLVTVEDPVEYQLEGVSQIQINQKIGLTFAEVLRSILRHDPDVIMVGEVRDLETARIAIQSALTGHIVLSTLHTDSAAGAVTRLADMGIEPYLITSALKGVLAQRLARTLCEACKQPFNTGDEATRLFADAGLTLGPSDTIYQATGCEQCGGTGYQGRTAVSELLEIDDDLREAILNRVDSPGLRDIASNSGMISMRGDGLGKVIDGTTTIDEILRVTEDGT